MGIHINNVKEITGMVLGHIILFQFEILISWQGIMRVQSSITAVCRLNKIKDAECFDKNDVFHAEAIHNFLLSTCNCF